MKTIALLSTVLIATSAASADSAVDRVYSLIESGALEGAEAAWHLAAAVAAPDLLPTHLTEGTEPAKCGTPAAMEAVALAEAHSGAPLAREALDLLARPSLSGPEYTYDTPSGHFKIHWTDQGADASSLSYAQLVGAAADLSWQVQCDEMGYYTPPSDLGLGGDTRYDVYIAAISSLGYTTYSGEPSNPATPNNDYASHIAILNTMGSDLAKVTMCHEFQHAVQMSYDVAEPTWFMENCAVWMEDMVYDEIDDYIGYLHSGDNPLRKPWWDIRSGGSTLYWYGGTTWARYIWLRMDELAIRQIWEECAYVWGNNMLASQGEIFSNWGLTWEQGFMEYGCWRWFVALNWYAGCNMYDDECVEWSPGPYTFPYHNVTTLPWSGNQGGSTYDTDCYGIHWIKVNLTNYQNGWISAHFDGRDNFEWDFGVIMWDNSGDHEFYWYNCASGSSICDVTVKGSGWDYVIFFPAFMSETSVDKLYTIDVTYTTDIEEGTEPETIELTVPSNPAGPGAEVLFTLPITSGARLDMYDMSGRVVSTLYDGEAAAGSHSVFLGSDISDGTYFLRLYAGGQVAARRLVFVR